MMRSVGEVIAPIVARIVDRPEPCYALVRKPGCGRALFPARIYRRLGMLTAEIDGVEVDPLDVWHSGALISQREWLQVVADRERGAPF